MSQNEIKSRPIIFSSEEVNAILEGRKTQTRRALKTQTRRALKPQPPLNPLGQRGKKWGKCDDKHYFCDIKFPYGNLGDRLYVKEDFAECTDETIYKANNHI